MKNESNFEVDNQEDDDLKTNIFSRILRGVVAFIAIVGLIYLSGIYQYFLYRKTPASVAQAPVESRVDAKTLIVPLTIFIITGSKSYGSIRTEDNARNLVENASRIWDQAGIALVIKNIHTVPKNDEEIQEFSSAPAAFIQSTNAFDPAAISVFLVGALGGINGIAFGGLNSVAVADYTTVYDFRVLAHEVGHIFGLRHISGSRGRLMYRGANGFELSLEEIEQARLIAEGLTK